MAEAGIHALRRVRCASRDDLAKWLEMWVKARTKGKTKHSDPVVRTFCDDALPGWCEGEAKEGRCFRADPTRVR